MRLIDADALVEKLQADFKRVYLNAGQKVNPEDYYIKRDSVFRADHFKEELDGFCEMVKAQPTIDAVPVIRCKDCKHRKDCTHTRSLGINGYCSEGEKT